MWLLRTGLPKSRPYLNSPKKDRRTASDETPGNAGRDEIENEILRDYQYDGLETCAVDGMCALNCPVDINTGDLVKRLRRENHSSFQNKIAVRVARYFGFLEGLATSGIRTGFF